MSGRKYRQRGYQDDEPRERGGRPGPRGPRKEGPRGRGLGKPTATVCRCAVCGAEQEGAIAVDSQCRCGADLHTCTHCLHFDTSAPLQCRQPIEERVAAKAKGNRCGHFEARRTAERAADSDTPASGKSAFDALFKGL